MVRLIHLLARLDMGWPVPSTGPYPRGFRWVFRSLCDSRRSKKRMTLSNRQHQPNYPVSGLWFNPDTALSVIPEADFQATVVALGRLHGWVVGYTHDSRRSEPGEPDLRMVHQDWGRVIFAECKDEAGHLIKGRWTKGRSRRWLPGQDDWAEALKACPGVEYYLWRPSDSDQVEAILGSPRPLV